MNKDILHKLDEIRRSYQTIGDSKKRQEKLYALELVYSAYKETPEAMERLS